MKKEVNIKSKPEVAKQFYHNFIEHINLQQVLISSVFIVFSIRDNVTYWMINKWLAALSIGSIMTVPANLQAVIKLPYPNPVGLIFLSVILTFIIVKAGIYADRMKEMNNEINSCAVSLV